MCNNLRQWKSNRCNSRRRNISFDSSSSPSFFAGQFGAVFKEMWQRFTYNGATAKEQAVFFFNIKEIMDNKFERQHQSHSKIGHIQYQTK